MWIEREVRALAAGQHGVVSRPQLLSIGVTPHEMTARMRSGRMEQLFDGVYHLDSVPATWLTQVRAALFACGAEAVASHRCAATVWALDGIRTQMIEVTVPYTESPEPEPVLVHRTRRQNDVTERTSISVTTLEKTILDLCSVVPERVVRKMARSAVHKRLTTPAQIDEAIGRFGGRGVTGTRMARRIVRFVEDDRSGSPAEIDLAMIIDLAPIPTPIQQLKILLPDATNAYPDFSWPHLMRIVEVDGFEAHGSPEQFARDLRRQNQLMEIGWELRRFTATEIAEEPERVRSELIRFVNRTSVNAGYA